MIVQDHEGASPKNHFAAYDGNGNVVGLIDSVTGEKSATYEYSPFGELIRVSGEMGMKNPIRYSSRYTDDETCLLYYGFRYYSPALGKWLSSDPIEESGGMNVFGFLGNDPVNAVDVLGLGWISKARAACKLKKASAILKELVERRKQLERGIVSLNKHIAEHRQKAIDFARDPYNYGDRKILRIPEEHHKGFIERTLRGWQIEIDAANKNLKDIRNEMSEIDEAIKQAQSCRCIAISILAPNTSDLLDDYSNGYLNEGDLAPGLMLDILGIIDPGVIDIMEWIYY